MWFQTLLSKPPSVPGRFRGIIIQVNPDVHFGDLLRSKRRKLTEITYSDRPVPNPSAPIGKVVSIYCN